MGSVYGPAIAIAFIALPACAPTGVTSSGPSSAKGLDPANATYTIDKSTISLANGRSERDAMPGSATKIVTTLSDQRAVGDVDGDGRADVVVVLACQPGGSGVFYYVAVLLGGANGVIATPAVLLGDRIAVNGVR